MASNGVLVSPSDPPVYKDVQQIVGRDLGQEDWGSRVNHVSYSSATETAHTIRNRGVGGHQEWLKSTDATRVAIVNDSGLVLTNLSVGNLTVDDNTTLGNAAGDTLTVNATSTFATSVTVSSGNLTVTVGTITAGSTVQGTRLISTIATGTAPLTVASTTKVTNLNADSLDDHDASFFLDTSGTGQTKTGALTVQGTFSGTGDVALGDANGDALTVIATSTFRNAAAAVQMFIDPANARTIFNSNSALSGAANDTVTISQGTLHIATPGSTIALEMRNGTGGTPFKVGPSAASNPDLIFNDGTAERFRVGSAAATYQAKVTGDFNVTGSSTLAGALTVSAGGIGVTGSSVFNSGVSIITGGLTITAGGAAVGGGINAVQAADSVGNGVRVTRHSAGSYTELYQGSDDHVHLAASSTASVLFQSTGHWVPGVDNAQDLGEAAHRWRTVYAGTGVINTSSRLVKRQIVPLDPERALAAVLATEIVTFRYRAAPAFPRVGFVAEDAHALLSPDGGSVEPHTTASVALAAVQALARRLDAMEASHA